ncbi:MAG: hypothetical protein H8D23_29615 [Candidatus Brocadiales bacterium]|nr:hypothetical protein [Candidatus Brocadiales bacterium]
MKIIITLNAVYTIIKDVVKWLFARKKGINGKSLLGILKKEKVAREKLSNALAELGGNRAYVYLFHNGPNYYTGESYKKVSCKVEETRNEFPATEFKQQLPISLFPAILKEMLEDNFIFRDYAKFDKYSPEKIFSRIHKAHHWAAYPIRTKIFSSTRYYGIVCIDWTKDMPPSKKKVERTLIELSADIKPLFVK